MAVPPERLSFILRPVPFQAGDEVEMGIAAIDPDLATTGDGGYHKVRQRQLVPQGGQIAPEVRGRTPVIPADLHIVRRTQARRNPIRLIFTAKAEKDFGDERPRQGHPIRIQQLVNGGLLR